MNIKLGSFKFDDLPLSADAQPALEEVRDSMNRFQAASEHMVFLLAGLGITAEVSVKSDWSKI